MAGRRAVAADGYFDVDVTASGPFAKPPNSCFLDGLQVSTGATWGKRNIRWNSQKKIVVQIKNTRSGEVVEIRPTAKLMALVMSFKPDSSAESRDDRTLEAIARKIAGLPDSQLLDLQRSSSQK
jgi:formylmethanofuran dehydrogenase subunit E